MDTALPSWMLRSENRYCRPCDRPVASKPRLRLAGIGIGATVAVLLAMIGFSALIGPFIMFTAPLILVAGFALGPLSALASEPPRCPHCERELIFASRQEVTRRRERTPRPASVPVGDMKAA